MPGREATAAARARTPRRPAAPPPAGCRRHGAGRSVRRRAAGLVRRRPLRHVALEVRQVPAGHLDGFLLVGAEDIDHPVRHLHRHRPDLLGAEHAQPAALDHGRATHADVGVGRGDDDVTAPEQRGVAGEAASRHNADERHLAAQRAEEREGLGVEPGHDGHVRVAGPAAAALGEEHHREAQPLDELEEAVLLAVIHLTLGAGQHGIVVRQHGAAGPVLVEEVAIDPPDAGHQAVGRRVGDEVLGAPARPLGRDDEAAVLLEAVRVAQVRDVLPGRASSACVPALGGLRTTGVERGVDAAAQLGELGTHPDGLGGAHAIRGAAPSARVRRSVALDQEQHVPGLHGVADGRRPARTVPAQPPSTTCSIFMDSSTTRTVACPHLVAGADVHPEHGAGERHRELGQPSHRGAGTSKPTSVPQVLRYATSWTGRRGATPQVPVG